MGTSSPERATVAGSLRLGAGWEEAEREGLVARLGKLDSRLGSFRPDDVDMELSVKERGKRQQKVTLECWLGGLPRVVGTGDDADLDQAVARARDEVIRQITDTLGRREPKANRQMRDTVRGSGEG